MPDQELLDRMAALERAVMDRDADLAEVCLHPDFALVLVQPAPAVMPRARWLEVLPGYLVHDWQVEEQSIDVDGDCAAVLQRIAMQATVLGEDRSGVFVISDVWRNGYDGWQLWRRHSTPQSASAMPGVSAGS